MKIIDLHCDTISRLTESDGQETLVRNSLHVDLEKLRKGGYLLQTFAMFVDMGEYPDPYAQCCRLLERFEQELEANKDQMGLVTAFHHLLENEQAEKLSALLSIEEGDVCGGDPARLLEFYERGVRMMTLTWNYKNRLASPNHLPDYRDGCRKMEPDTKEGLTETGVFFVEEMQRLSMMIDVSHLGDKGIYDVLAHTEGPILASHSNARALCGHVRNLPDDLIRKIAERGGIIGINFYPRFVAPLTESKPKTTVSRLISHICHLKNTGGIDCIALGTDFDGMKGNMEIADAAKMQLLVQGLCKHGFLPCEIEKICYGNAKAFLREMLP